MASSCLLHCVQFLVFVFVFVLFCFLFFVFFFFTGFFFWLGSFCSFTVFFLLGSVSLRTKKKKLHRVIDMGPTNSVKNIE